MTLRQGERKLASIQLLTNLVYLSFLALHGLHQDGPRRARILAKFDVAERRAWIKKMMKSNVVNMFARAFNHGGGPAAIAPADQFDFAIRLAHGLAEFDGLGDGGIAGKAPPAE